MQPPAVSLLERCRLTQPRPHLNQVCAAAVCAAQCMARAWVQSTAHALVTRAQVTFSYAGGALGLQRAGAPGSVLPVADCHLQAAGASALLRSAAAALRACRQGGRDGAHAQRAAALRGLEAELVGLVVRRGVDAAGGPAYMAVLQTGPPARAGAAAGRGRDAGLDAGSLGRGEARDRAGGPAAEAACGGAGSAAVSAPGKGAGAGSRGGGPASGAAGGRRAAPGRPPAGAEESAAAGKGPRGGGAGASSESPEGTDARALAGARVLAERLAADVPGLACVVLLPRAPAALDAAACGHVAGVVARGQARGGERGLVGRDAPGAGWPAACVVCAVPQPGRPPVRSQEARAQAWHRM